MTKDILDTNRRSILSVALATLVLLSAGTAVTFTASAAGSTTVSLSPSDQRVESGNTTTYEIVVENTDNGIGTTNANVTIADPSVGKITDLTIAGEAANQDVDIADDGSSVSFDAIYFGSALSDDPNGVTVATVTVEGTAAAGSSDLSLDVTEISDAAGEVYEVTSSEGATLTVGEQRTATATESSTATPTETPTATPTETETATPSETDTQATTTTDETDGERTLDGAAISDSLSDSGLSDRQVESVGSALADSDLTDGEITAITDALAGDGLTDDQRTAVADAIAAGDLTDEQLRSLADALRDGQLTDEERANLGFLDAGGERTLDEAAITDSLADSGLDDAQIDGVSAALADSDLTDGEITAITDALAGDGLTDEQRETIADIVGAGGLTDEQLRALAGALDDGRLTDAERDTLGFLGEAGVTYYQVDFVAGEAIENLRGPNGTYTTDRLLRFAHGSTEEPITRRSDGEFVTDHLLADRIESRNITVANGTATTTFTVAEGESITLTLASYEKVGPGWSPETETLQEFVNSETRTFESGTHTLTVDLPGEDDSNDGNDAE